jgi:hypothetical protein
VHNLATGTSTGAGTDGNSVPESNALQFITFYTGSLAAGEIFTFDYATSFQYSDIDATIIPSLSRVELISPRDYTSGPNALFAV